MEWHVEGLQAELSIETELLEAKEIFVNVLRIVATNKLFAAVVECTDTIGASVFGESGTLESRLGYRAVPPSNM
jgi:hypothetical protein